MNTYQNSFDGNIPQDVTARPGENAIRKSKRCMCQLFCNDTQHAQSFP